MIWILAITLPMLATLAVPRLAARPHAIGLLLMAATLPAIAAAWTLPPLAHLPWFLLGSDLGVDAPRRVLLVLAAILWACAGWFAGGYLRGAPRIRSFCVFFLGAMTGNFGLILAEDVPTFYTFFALMTFSSYGLVVHTREDTALRAGRVYLVMAILGELFLITALYLAVLAADSMLLDKLAPALAEHPHGQWIFLLGLIGFGVKVGAIPLYFWLPLAHPVAPAPASAVLSGCMIKAGLLGWMHLAPVGLVSWTSMSSAIIALGMAAALGAVIIGLCQTDPKTNLAYSSISQMGLITVMLGIGLHAGVPPKVLLPALALYALNHGLAKGLLFLGTALPGATCGKWRAVMWAGLAWAVLSIAGGPLTAGAFTKYLIKTLTPDAPAPWAAALPILLTLSAVATTLLLSRFLFLLSRKNSADPSTPPPLAMLAPWMLLLAACASWLWLVPKLVPRVLVDLVAENMTIASLQLSPGVIWGSLWPVLLGTALFVAFGLRLRIPLLIQTTRPLIPPGDLIEPILAAMRAMARSVSRLASHAKRLPLRNLNLEKYIYGLLEKTDTRDTTRAADGLLRHLPVAGAGFIALFLLLILLLR